jgi:glycosyltransferase involved in cell wall biosynthesis
MKTIALFDHKVVSGNPIGGCHLRILEALSGEYQFTVFATQFANPCPEHIRWVRVPAPPRPLVAQFLCYHLLAPLVYLAVRLKQGTAFDLVQTMENCALRSDVAYVQFCHRAYLRRHWKDSGAHGVRGWIRWLDHRARALLEPAVYRRAGRIVVPSRGFAAELVEEYPWLREKVVVVPNPIDVPRLRRPKGFDRVGFRARFGLRGDDVVLIFVALGQYERKGLPLLLEALNRIPDPAFRLLVVGGERDLVSHYREQARRRGLDQRVVFAGMQGDVAPFLWAADAFAFPSAYETFSLVSFEAGAAGLPLLISPLHGIGEVLRDGDNGLVLERTTAGVEAGLRRFLEFSPDERRRMGERARGTVAAYSVPRFLAAWREFYAEILGEPVRMPAARA